MKIANTFIFLLYFPGVIFAASSMNGELYISPKDINKMLLSTQEYFKFKHYYNPKNEIASIFTSDRSNTHEIHFKHLDFNQVLNRETVSYQFLPLYDFTNEKDIEEYQNNIKVLPHGLSLFKIKFPFF